MRSWDGNGADETCYQTQTPLWMHYTIPIGAARGHTYGEFREFEVAEEAHFCCGVWDPAAKQP